MQNQEQRYESVKALIYKQVYKFAAQYGGDVDDLAGEAHIHFMEGDMRFTDGQTATGLDIEQPYHIVIKNHVWYGLFDTMRTRVRRQGIAAMQHAGEHDIDLADRAGLDVEVLRIDSGDDVKTVLDLVFDPPAAVAKESQAKGGTPRNIRSTIRTYLTKRGWTPERINSSFDAIQKELV